MTLDDLLHLLKETSFSQALRESDLAFPAIECVHVAAICLVVGTIAVADLRLLGVASKGRPVEAVVKSVTPVTWSAFALAAATGLLLFTARPVVYGHNPFFLTKMALIVLAGLNMALFHLLIDRRPDAPLLGGRGPRLGQISGLLSLILWTLVVACGRWIGFSI
jgi:hypothetical protein